MAAMPGTPSLGLSLGIDPFSQASNGLDNFGGYGGASIGGVSFGGGGTALSPVIKDVGTVVALVIGAVWLWKQVGRK